MRFYHGEWYSENLFPSLKLCVSCDNQCKELCIFFNYLCAEDESLLSKTSFCSLQFLLSYCPPGSFCNFKSLLDSNYLRVDEHKSCLICNVETMNELLEMIARIALTFIFSLLLTVK